MIGLSAAIFQQHGPWDLLILIPAISGSGVPKKYCAYWWCYIFIRLEGMHLAPDPQYPVGYSSLCCRTWGFTFSSGGWTWRTRYWTTHALVPQFRTNVFLRIFILLCFCENIYCSFFHLLPSVHFLYEQKVLFFSKHCSMFPCHWRYSFFIW